MASSTAPASSLPLFPQRLGSLDAYRGFVMLLMMGEVLHFSTMADLHPGNFFWAFLGYHQNHVEWVGCVLHDMIQPSFSFIVGVALPFSIAARTVKGQSPSGMTLHAFWRALLLILLGVFLRSMGSNQTNWTFEDTLSQIGLGYGFLFLLGFRSVRAQWISVAAILLGYWAAFALYPLPGPNFDWAAIGLTPDWPGNLTGFAAHWNKNTNFAWAFDTWFMNLFPRGKVFVRNGGGYSTLSFIPTLATMILGLIGGGVLHSDRTSKAKVCWLVIAGLISLAAGWSLGALGICPVVKRIWTPSWVLFSGGWCFLLLAAFYAVIDIWEQKGWAFPLKVIGMNSIAAYCIAHLFENFISSNLKTHLGQDFFKLFGEANEPFFHGAAVLLGMWLILFWMYRRKLFLRI
jgi:heparan-alpha-glucosaminide N-acetyltransferase